MAKQTIGTLSLSQIFQRGPFHPSNCKCAHCGSRLGRPSPARWARAPRPRFSVAGPGALRPGQEAQKCDEPTSDLPTSELRRVRASASELHKKKPCGLRLSFSDSVNDPSLLRVTLESGPLNMLAATVAVLAKNQQDLVPTSISPGIGGKYLQETMVFTQHFL